MTLAKYISDLLYRYDCVIVPNFGAFLAQRKSAQVLEVGNVFYPPSKALSFNVQVQHNDGLLASHISKIEQITYDKAVEKISSEVASIKSALKNETIVVENIGTLALNPEENIVFTPTESINYLTESFGLSSFVSNAIDRSERDILISQVEKLEESVPAITITPDPVVSEEEKEPTPVIRSFPIVRYAAAAALVLGLGFTADYFKRQDNIAYATETKQQANKEVIQEGTFDLGVLPAINLSVEHEILKPTGKYHIVAGAFRYEENAKRKMSQLTTDGFQPILIGKNRYGLHQVAYTSLETADEALSKLREIRSSNDKNAWLLVQELN